MFKPKFLALVLVSLILVSGCAGTENKDIQEGVSDDTPSLVVPFSKGPTGPPGVKGPSAPPEEMNAMTEREDVTFSLPE